MSNERLSPSVVLSAVQPDYPRLAQPWRIVSPDRGGGGRGGEGRDDDDDDVGLLAILQGSCQGYICLQGFQLGSSGEGGHHMFSWAAQREGEGVLEPSEQPWLF